MTKEYTLCDYDQGHIDGIQVGYELAMQRLDKIRAEILERMRNSGGEPNRDIAFNVCLQIIDKYKAESENEE